MKNLFLFILLNTSISVFAQDIEPIIAKHIEAIGGYENWKKVKTLQYEIQTNDDADTLYATNTFHFPNQIKSELKIAKRGGIAKKSSKPFPFFILINQAKGWAYLPDYDSVFTLTKSEIEHWKEELNFENVLINWKEKNIKVTYMAYEEFNNDNHYKLLVQLPNGKEFYYYISTHTYLIAKIVQIHADELNTTDFIEYQKLTNGLIFPKISNINGVISTINNVKINLPLPKTFFNFNFQKK